MHLAHAAMAFCGSIFTAYAALAQPGPPTSPPGKTPITSPSPEGIPLDKLPASLRLGARVNLIQRQIGVIPILVIVRDDASYLEAIAGWRVGPEIARRYPVLIDDGTLDAQLAIARFIRAFQPAAVVRFAAGDDRLVDSTAARRKAIESTVAATWEAADASALLKHWATVGFDPPGVVVASTGDSAWTAAVALAAARGQPIVWHDHDLAAQVSGWMPMAAADGISNLITTQLDKSGLSYKALGDQIDSVTICLHLPVKIQLAEGDKRGQLALTDVIGRVTTEPRRDRWAYAGQIIGTKSRAAYAAMSSLFLMPDKAWLFDGYDSTSPWNNWDATETGKVFSSVGVEPTVIDGPAGAGLDSWRTAAKWGIDAGIATVTTKGNADFFDLASGQGKSVDIPLLRRPTITYFVHSWSATSPTLRGSIGAVWLERGCYAYVGSVNEPYLQAFPPTPQLAKRLLTGLPIAAAIRFDNAEPWKITCLGDPLLTLGPAAPRIKTPLPLKAATEAADELPALLKSKDFAGALRLLAMLGRDADGARLVNALAADKAHPLTPEAAVPGLACAFMAKDTQAVLAAGRALQPILRDDARVEREGLHVLKDMLWNALESPTPADVATAQHAEVLSWALRPEVLARDVGAAAGLLRRTKGDAAARALVDRALMNVKDRATSDALERLK